MDGKIVGLLAALVALIGFGVANALTRTTSQVLGPTRAIILRNVIVVSILLVATAFTGLPQQIDLGHLLVTIILSAISYFGLYFFGKATASGKVSIVVPVATSNALVTTLVSVLVFGQILGLGKVVSLILVIAGVILISTNFKELKETKIFDPATGLPYALLAFLIWGSTFAFFHIPIGWFGPIFFSLILESTILVVSTLQQLLTAGKVEFPRDVLRNVRIPVLMVGIFSAIGGLGMNVGFGSGVGAPVVSSFIAASPIVSTIIGVAVYKEKPSLQQILAMLLMVLGVIGISTL